jgi:hypothetical protein
MPLRKYLWMFFVVGWSSVRAQSTGIRVFAFLSPECPLCQNYSRTLNELSSQYAGRVQFAGIFPGRTVSANDVAGFARKYHLSFPVSRDSDMHRTHALHVTTTPEVVVLGSDQTLVYQGAIDNWYKALGKAQTHPTENYLQDAIHCALRHVSPPVKYVRPVGCLINDF